MSLQPGPHQAAALADVTRALALHDRTQLASACGTGKTLTGRWHAQACGSQVTVDDARAFALAVTRIGAASAGVWPQPAAAVSAPGGP